MNQRDAILSHMKTLTNYHLLEVKYLGPTNNKGSRVKVTSYRFNEYRIFDFDSRYSRACDQAVEWCENVQGLEVVGTAEGGGVDYILSDTFKPFWK